MMRRAGPLIGIQLLISFSSSRRAIPLVSLLSHGFGNLEPFADMREIQHRADVQCRKLGKQKKYQLYLHNVSKDINKVTPNIHYH